MKVDAGIGHQLEKVPEAVRAAEAAGYDGVRTAEMNHDPFFPLLLHPYPDRWLTHGPWERQGPGASSPDSEDFVSLARRVGYTTDDWQACARHLQTDIAHYMRATSEFFKRQFGGL